MLFFVAPLFNGLNLASRSPVLYRGAAMPAAMAPGRANGLLCSSLRRWGVFLARTAAAAQPSDSASTGGYKRVGLHHKWIPKLLTSDSEVDRGDRTGAESITITITIQ